MELKNSKNILIHPPQTLSAREIESYQSKCLKHIILRVRRREKGQNIIINFSIQMLIGKEEGRVGYKLDKDTPTNILIYLTSFRNWLLSYYTIYLTTTQEEAVYKVT